MSARIFFKQRDLFARYTVRVAFQEVDSLPSGPEWHARSEAFTKRSPKAGEHRILPRLIHPVILYVRVFIKKVNKVTLIPNFFQSRALKTSVLETAGNDSLHTS